MSDIFISYDSTDRKTAERLVKALEQLGFSVWWDRKIIPGQRFGNALETALEKASCVIVICSQASVKSQSTNTEASLAMDRGILFPVLVEYAEIPLRFSRCRFSDLTKWDGSIDAPSFQRLLESISLMRSASCEMSQPVSMEPRSRAGGAIINALESMTEKVRSGVGGLFSRRRRKPGSDRPGVDFAAFGPVSIAPGSNAIVDIWAYPAGQFSRVKALAEEVSRGEELGRAVGLEIELDSLITVELVIHGLTITQPVGAIVWKGMPVNASFAVNAPAGIRPGTFPGHAVLRADGVKFCVLTCIITVSEQSNPEPGCCGQQQRRVRTAFASYASADREGAFARLQGIQKAVPDMDIFVDVMRLRSGDDWASKLETEVPRKDVFYLFWSKEACRSTWVEREWQMALDRRGLSYIDPIPLQDPNDLDIPASLSALHFNDAYLMHIEYQRLRTLQHEST